MKQKNSLLLHLYQHQSTGISFPEQGKAKQDHAAGEERASEVKSAKAPFPQQSAPSELWVREASLFTELLQDAAPARTSSRSHRKAAMSAAKATCQSTTASMARRSGSRGGLGQIFEGNFDVLAQVHSMFQMCICSQCDVPPWPTVTLPRFLTLFRLQNSCWSCF